MLILSSCLTASACCTPNPPPGPVAIDNHLDCQKQIILTQREPDIGAIKFTIFGHPVEIGSVKITPIKLQNATEVMFIADQMQYSFCIAANKAKSDDLIKMQVDYSRQLIFLEGFTSAVAKASSDAEFDNAMRTFTAYFPATPAAPGAEVPKAPPGAPTPATQPQAVADATAAQQKAEQAAAALKATVGTPDAPKAEPSVAPAPTVPAAPAAPNPGGA